MLAGFASVDITPRVGSRLNGFIARNSESTGIDLPLAARALWLEEADARALFVGLDLLGLEPAFADAVVTRLAEALDLPGEAIVLACTHTHSGPMTAPLRGLGPADGAYLAVLADRILQAASEAVSSRQPVRLRWGRAPLAIGVNRRQPSPDGSGVILGWNPRGPSDAEVRVLCLEGGDAPILLIHHACHPYCLGGEHTLISPDFWGYAAAALSEEGCHCIYLNGCAGNIRVRTAYQGPEAARQTGREVARAALEAFRRAREDAEAVVRVRSSAIELPYDALPDLSRIEAQLSRPDRTVRDSERGNPDVRARIQEAWRQWLAELTGILAERGALPPLVCRVSVARIGGGGLVVFPGEVFYEVGRMTADRIQADPVCVAAYGHGYIGYVPAPDAYPQGGYEIDEAHRYVGLWRVAPEAAGRLQGAALQLWTACGGRVRSVNTA